MNFVKFNSLFHSIFVPLVFILLLPVGARSSVQLGTGFNSATSGRLVPALNLGVGGDSFEMQFSSTGVSTTAYYHSSYRLSGYWTWKAGEFLLGTVEAGFGVGTLYAVRSFKESDTETETKSDYVVGPAFFVRWVFLGPAFIGVDSLYGLVGPSNRYGDIIGLNARDNVNFVIGFRL